jgi:lipopolysaccharide transport system permease protein
VKDNILLAFSFAKRDLRERYVGTGFGSLWFILSPMVMIFIYTVIFSDFMKMKLNIIDNSYSYSIYLIPGLLAWTAFSNTIMRLNTSFFEKAGLIKKINIPMYIFQLAMVLSELFTFIISMILGLIFLLIVDQPITIGFLWLFPLIIIQTIFAYGLGVIFSLFTPFFKDMKEIIPIIIQLWFWMTPIIYLSTMIENKYPLLLEYNPFYYFVKTYQNIFLHGNIISIADFGTICLLALCSILIAAYLYKKMIATIKDII